MSELDYAAEHPEWEAEDAAGDDTFETKIAEDNEQVRPVAPVPQGPPDPVANSRGLCVVRDPV